jgi:hypothetical protein
MEITEMAWAIAEYRILEVENTVFKTTPTFSTQQHEKWHFMSMAVLKRFFTQPAPRNCSLKENCDCRTMTSTFT